MPIMVGNADLMEQWWASKHGSSGLDSGLVVGKLYNFSFINYCLSFKICGKKILTVCERALSLSRGHPCHCVCSLYCWCYCGISVLGSSPQGIEWDSSVMTSHREELEGRTGSLNLFDPLIMCVQVLCASAFHRTLLYIGENTLFSRSVALKSPK